MDAYQLIGNNAFFNLVPAFPMWLHDNEEFVSVMPIKYKSCDSKKYDILPGGLLSADILTSLFKKKYEILYFSFLQIFQQETYAHVNMFVFNMLSTFLDGQLKCRWCVLACKMDHCWSGVMSGLAYLLINTSAVHWEIKLHGCWGLFGVLTGS